LLGAFEEADGARQIEMLRVNVEALTDLARRFLPGMVARRRGGILNVSSTAAFQPGPGMAVYYASKAYVLSLSEALYYEVRNFGVTVTALCPGPTETGFQSTAGLHGSRLFRSMRVMDAASVARTGYEGFRARKRVVIPGTINDLLAHGARIMPSVGARIAARLHTRENH
jgi:short-subunit dehydrogenase